MKRTIKNLMGFTMGATDGEIGKVKDFYFDDVTWTIRYLVVETGNWLSNRKVLISPEALLQCDWENETFPVNLTKEQIEKSPSIDTDQPVSRQQEMELYSHYPWTNYWGSNLWAGSMGTTGMMMPMSAVPMEEAVKNNNNARDTVADGDPHLRSAKSVQGYTIHTLDDTIGDVEDFLVDDSSWTIHYMVVDTGNWFPGKKVTISPDLIKEINWETSEVIINASVEQVKNSPEYDVSKQISTEYESVLKNYYGRFIS
ncbi:MAG: PRC-barrel domain-containing protein [Chitinophagaceae bacterium]